MKGSDKEREERMSSPDYSSFLVLLTERAIRRLPFGMLTELSYRFIPQPEEGVSEADYRESLLVLLHQGRIWLNQTALTLRLATDKFGIVQRELKEAQAKTAAEKTHRETHEKALARAVSIISFLKKELDWHGQNHTT